MDLVTHSVHRGLDRVRGSAHGKGYLAENSSNFRQIPYTNDEVFRVRGNSLRWQSWKRANPGIHSNMDNRVKRTRSGRPIKTEFDEEDSQPTPFKPNTAGAQSGLGKRRLGEDEK